MNPKHLSRREAEQLVVDHLKFARRRILQYAARTPNVDPDELESAGMAGLIRAAQNFDPSQGHVFATYAGVVIEDFMRRARNREWRRANMFDDRASSQLGEDPEDADDCLRRAVDRHHADHADAVLAALDGRDGLADWLDRISDPRHQEALLRRLRGDNIYDIAAHFEVHETTVRRWLWAAQDAGKALTESMSS